MVNEFRRARRRTVAGTVSVVDTMTDVTVGRLGNVSETGLLIFASAPLVDDALYQLRFDVDSPATGPVTVEAGAHLLWTSSASVPGQTWAGFRFISVPEAQLKLLRQWLDAPGAKYA